MPYSVRHHIKCNFKLPRNESSALLTQHSYRSLNTQNTKELKTVPDFNKIGINACRTKTTFKYDSFKTSN